MTVNPVALPPAGSRHRTIGEYIIHGGLACLACFASGMVAASYSAGGRDKQWLVEYTTESTHGRRGAVVRRGVSVASEAICTALLEGCTGEGGMNSFLPRHVARGNCICCLSSTLSFAAHHETETPIKALRQCDQSSEVLTPPLIEGLAKGTKNGLRKKKRNRETILVV